jgi:hypothetical protein
MLDEIKFILDKYDYDWTSTAEYLPGRYRLSIMKREPESLPPLGIHVTDKVIAKERLGGGDG